MARESRILLKRCRRSSVPTELALLPWPGIGKRRRVSKLRFILEYELRKKNATGSFIRIESDGRRLTFTRVIGDQNEVLTTSRECLDALPTHIVGYSSGLNETLSIPYFRTSALYSEEIRTRAQADRRKSSETTPVENTRALFMDYESNALTVVSNYFFQSKAKLRLFKDTLRIRDVAGFDIRFRPVYQRIKPVELTRELQGYVKALRDSAEDVQSGGRSGAELFRFRNTRSCTTKLRRHFSDGQHFFSAVYKLSLLNALALKGRDRTFFLRDRLKEGQLERPPAVSPEDRVFSIENIQLQLVQPKKVIDYAGISDGEHQFLQIFGTIILFKDRGTLFLLDEPETHFNPQWRRRFVQDLDSISTTANQEFVVSTHSPFVVSGCHGDQVINFERAKGYTSGSHVDFETFGASYDFILARLFDLPSMIAGQALSEMREVLKSTSLDRLENSIADFGESFEKRFLFERIAKLKRAKRRRRQ